MVRDALFAGDVGKRYLVVPVIRRVIDRVAACRNGGCPRPRVDGRVGDGGLVVIVPAIVVENVAFLDSHLLARKFTGSGEARLGVVVGNIDDERVAFPVAARVAVPELDRLREVWLAI